FVPEYVIPLSQHIGAPAVAEVEKGQKVQRGDRIASPGGYVSVAYHSPVSGVVKTVELRDHPCGEARPSIVIEADPFSSQKFQQRGELDWLNMSTPQFISLVQGAGIVGLGGAAFPTHVKIAVPEGKNCRFLILNGCECEPFLTADHRVMLENANSLLYGTRLLAKFLGAQKAYIGIELNKLDAIEILKQKAAEQEYDVEVVPLEVKYPQGAEKMLITAILRKEVPSGKLPIDMDVVVSNVSTTVAIADYFQSQKPLIERVLTVTGPGIRRPANMRVPVGTPIRDVLDACGGLVDETSRIILGGPMMGMVQKSLDVPITKGTSGILALTDREVHELKTYKCVRCARCIEACPAFLNPSQLGLLARKSRFEEMVDASLMDCMECASCSFACPSGIPLVQSFRMAKSYVREKKAKE
ncbi:electron transport complex subunit RsxC, partial [bacterium]|nr:electron transport complex subunit RsxC [bacterium]